MLSIHTQLPALVPHVAPRVAPMTMSANKVGAILAAILLNRAYAAHTHRC